MCLRLVSPNFRRGLSVTKFKLILLTVVPKNWVHLLVGVEPIDTTKPKIGRRKDLLLLAASKENTGDLSQSIVTLNNKIGEVLS